MGFLGGPPRPPKCPGERKAEGVRGDAEGTVGRQHRQRGSHGSEGQLRPPPPPPSCRDADSPAAPAGAQPCARLRSGPRACAPRRGPTSAASSRPLCGRSSQQPWDAAPPAALGPDSAPSPGPRHRVLCARWSHGSKSSPPDCSATTSVWRASVTHTPLSHTRTSLNFFSQRFSLLVVMWLSDAPVLPPPVGRGAHESEPLTHCAQRRPPHQGPQAFSSAHLWTFRCQPRTAF